jgi:hypothetical protein
MQLETWIKIKIFAPQLKAILQIYGFYQQAHEMRWQKEKTPQ